MIREFQMDDINKVADIWLDTNIKAHNFIPAEYWKSNFKSVKEALLLAEVYVYEYDTEIQGFISHRCMQMFFLWREYGITPQR